MFSVLILTLNEERKLPACLESVVECDDVVVLDSGSTDRTVSLAHAAGARVVVNAFEDFAQQRNYAHQAIEFRYPWVFHLDADEQMTRALHTECAAYRGDEPLDGCYAAPRMLWNGRWIPHCTDYPAWQSRFVKARGFRFVQEGHGQREAPHMRMAQLRANYLHDLSADGTEGWLEKHRRYAREEAKAFLANENEVQPPMRAIIHGPALARRRAIKLLSYRLPARSALRFVYQYLFRRGFLDGCSGFRYCRLLARYEQYASEELARLRADRRASPAR